MKLNCAVQGMLNSKARVVYVKEKYIPYITGSEGMDVRIEICDKTMDMKVILEIPFDSEQLVGDVSKEAGYHVVEMFSEFQEIFRWLRGFWQFGDSVACDFQLHLSTSVWTLIPETEQEERIILNIRMITLQDMNELFCNNDIGDWVDMTINVVDRPNLSRIRDLYYLTRNLVKTNCFKDAWYQIQYMATLVEDKDHFGSCIELVLERIQDDHSEYRKQLRRMLMFLPGQQSAIILYIFAMRAGGLDGPTSENIPKDGCILYAFDIVLLEAFFEYLLSA